MTMRILSLILLFAPLCSLSQTKAIIDDDFSSNVNQWEIDEIQTIRDGALFLNTTQDGDEAVVSRYIDPDLNFIISADFTQISGTNQCSYGLTWADSENDFNIFLISSMGDYVIFTGNPQQIKGWKKSSILSKSQGQTHALRIVNSSGKLSFFVDGHLIDERKAFPFYGPDLGFLVMDQGLIKVDNYKFLQDQEIALPAETTTFEKEDLGSLINSDDDELGPIISSDGKTLYFARQNVAENIGGEYDDEDVWLSTFQNDRWTFARNMGRPVNTPTSDNLVAVSADNNSLIFAKAQTLFIKNRTRSSWSEAEKIPLSFQNLSAYFVASISADSKAILFSANLMTNLFPGLRRKDGDLFVCLKQKDNTWGTPVNLGKSINTAGNETSPFLSADGKTLYFATDGRPGFGSQDIFYSRRLDDSWTSWSDPVNLGTSVNTPGFDAYYTVPAQGDFAYFVSQGRAGKGDIFRIRLHEEIKPQPVTVVSGLVLDSKTKAALAARIHFEDLSKGVEVGEARSDPATGAYRIVLPFGTTYGIRASLLDYYSIHENIELKQTSGSRFTEIKKDLLMTPLVVGETIKLNNVFFEAGLPVLKSESYPELNRLIEILKENKTIIIELAGHTDNKGDAETLMKLSQDRVATVENYLVNNGITTERVDGKGYGATQPVAPSDTEENSRLNRRVEFRIIKK